MVAIAVLSAGTGDTGRSKRGLGLFESAQSRRVETDDEAPEWGRCLSHKNYHKHNSGSGRDPVKRMSLETIRVLQKAFCKCTTMSVNHVYIGVA